MPHQERVAHTTLHILPGSSLRSPGMACYTEPSTLERSVQLARFVGIAPTIEKRD
ncbi:MAG: hypothetical protein H7095_02120 [Pseudopedobacter sp.]|nr:hypothetical protein [Deinococcales bacterium]